MLADRYELDHEIGRGGMGSVWLGHDTVLDRDVAIKQIGMAHGGAAPDLERAEREAHLAARINHQNVVAVFDLVDEDGHQWLVMEHVDGPTLAALIAESGALRADELTPVVRQVAGALAAAHAHGIVHRDVKPSNILLTREGVAKLSDFGVARAQADASLTQTGLVTGSPAYLSPEVASGRTATAASDVWSLGATVFHALAGEPPYQAKDNVLGAMYRIVNDEPPRLASDGPLTDLVARMMQHDPAARPTMGQIELALTDVDEPDALADLDATQGFDAFAMPPEPTPSTAFHPLEPPVTVPLTAPAPDPTIAAPTPPPPPTAVTTGPAPTASSHVVAKRSRTPWFAAAGAAAAVLIVAAFLGLLGDGDDADTARPLPVGSSGTPSPSPSSTAGGVTAQALEGFAADYLRTASNDPADGFAMLTPDYQKASNGLKGYRGFWGKVKDLDVEQISADPDAMRVSYTYSYDLKGDRRTESVTLELEQSGDSFLISGAV